MRIAFYWPFNRAEEIYDYWRDGLRAAIEEIGKEHDVEVFLDHEPEGEFDFILGWGDSNINTLPSFTCKKGLILTTMPENFDNLRKLDVIYCESRPVYEAVRAQGLHAVHAFGTDTDFFSPDPKVKKDLEYFYPATFSPWKRQEDIAHLGKKLWCVGTVQPDGSEQLKACYDNGVNVALGYFKAEHIRDLYRRAKNVIIPSVHGSERTVLEAMSCGILPVVSNPANFKARSYIQELKASHLSPREFVLKYYNPKQYASKILQGVQWTK